MGHTLTSTYSCIPVAALLLWRRVRQAGPAGPARLSAPQKMRTNVNKLPSRTAEKQRTSASLTCTRSSHGNSFHRSAPCLVDGTGSPSRPPPWIVSRAKDCQLRGASNLTSLAGSFCRYTFSRRYFRTKVAFEVLRCQPSGIHPWFPLHCGGSYT